MKFFAVSLLILVTLPAFPQASFRVHPLPLPPEISYYDNQFSGLSVHDGRLFLMSESRLQDRAEGKLYAIRLNDAERLMKDTSAAAPWEKIHIYNLDSLRLRIDSLEKIYEGLEAMVIDRDDIYFSVETATPAPDCYLLKGKLSDTAVVLDTHFLVPLPKFTRPDGRHIYNAGFEAMGKSGEFFFALYEYNSFSPDNQAWVLDKFSFSGEPYLHPFPVDKIPFRVTDMTPVGNNHFTAINYFYKGGGEDTVYRLPASDTTGNRLINENGTYHNYCRLIDLVITPERVSWKPLWEFPPGLNEYNWEGIAAFKDGYFIMNDKYSPRPYHSTLLYLEKE